VTRDDSVDILNFTFDDSSQEDQEAGFSNVYFVDLSPNNPIVPEEIQAIRVGITGSDLWGPAFLVVWGERPAADRIVPLAIALTPKVVLSTDPSEGVISFTIRPVGLGQLDTIIQSVLLMIVTEDSDNAGTESPFGFSITVGGTTILDAQFPGGTGEFNPERGGANAFQLVVRPPFFSKGGLKADSIRLSINGDDAWKPQSLFLFGLDKLVPDEESTSGRPTVLVPLVHIDHWDLGTLSTDPNEGVPSVVLPLVE
jgi:hypothetical protein